MSTYSGSDAVPAPVHLSSGPRRDHGTWMVAGMLVVAAIVAYANSLSVPLLFDDISSIATNPSIRSWQTALFPPEDLTVSGRPLVNLTLAINYALHGTDVRGYHAVNIALHAAVALLLFGLMRRTLARSNRPEGSSAENQSRLAGASGPAFAVALLWLLHPLQTSTVTYTIQRTEILVSLFYVATIYSLARSEGSATPGRWQAASVLACAAGMMSKEVMVSAPFIALLYDRTFLAGNFATTWRRRKVYYVALAVTWIPLVGLMSGTAGRGGTAGFGIGLSSWSYAVTQCQAIVHYLRLVVWPHPLVFDHGPEALVRNEIAVLPQAALLVLIAGATVMGIWRRSALGFLGAVFFALLAPTSSVVPLLDTIVEHRMYLALAPILIALVLGTRAVLRRTRFGTLALLVATAVVAACVSIQRNFDYHSSLHLWRDTAEKCPDNPRAWASLGRDLLAADRVDEAAECLRRSVTLAPHHAAVRHLLANAEARLGNLSAAVEQFDEALRLEPDNARLRNDAGNVRLQRGDFERAIADLTAATRLDPTLAEAHYNLGNAWRVARRLPDATAAYRAAVELAPEFVEAHFNLANALASWGRLDEAEIHFRAVTQIRPEFAGGWTALGRVLARLGRSDEAQEALDRASRLVSGAPGTEASRPVPETEDISSKPIRDLEIPARSPP